MCIEIPSDVQEFIDNLKRSLPEIKAIWLIGSRVNPTDRPPRDWDFLIIANPVDFSRITALKHCRKNNIDVFIVDANGEFEELWFVPSPERQKPKKGSLVDWEWHEISNTEAYYVGAKAIPNSKHINVEEKRAICLWRSSLYHFEHRKDQII